MVEALGILETEPEEVEAALATLDKTDKKVEEVAEVTLARVTDA